MVEISAAASAEEMIRHIRDFWQSRKEICHPSPSFAFRVINQLMAELVGWNKLFRPWFDRKHGISAVSELVNAFKFYAPACIGATLIVRTVFAPWCRVLQSLKCPGGLRGGFSKIAKSCAFA